MKLIELKVDMFSGYTQTHTHTEDIVNRMNLYTRVLPHHIFFIFYIYKNLAYTLIHTAYLK